MKVIDCKNKCVHCGEDTSLGSGRFVNRIPGDVYDDDAKALRDGYACAECLAIECGRCGETIDHDEDISSWQIFGWENDPGQFGDGSYKICDDCLTAQERKMWEANQ